MLLMQESQAQRTDRGIEHTKNKKAVSKELVNSSSAVKLNRDKDEFEDNIYKDEDYQQFQTPQVNQGKRKAKPASGL